MQLWYGLKYISGAQDSIGKWRGAGLWSWIWITSRTFMLFTKPTNQPRLMLVLPRQDVCKWQWAEISLFTPPPPSVTLCKILSAITENSHKYILLDRCGFVCKRFVFFGHTFQSDIMCQSSGVDNWVNKRSYWSSVLPTSTQIGARHVLILIL